MTTISEADVHHLVKPKWHRLASYIRRGAKVDEQWQTFVEYTFDNGETLTLKAKSPEGYLLPAYAGYELLRVTIPYELVDVASRDLRGAIRREKIIGWWFERWRVPGMPITPSGEVDPLGFGGFGTFGCIKFPDGKIQPVDPYRHEALGIRRVPASLLLPDEEAWLDIIKVEHAANKERERAIDSGEDAAGNLVCQEYFGGCPRCGRCQVLNVGRTHWGHCDEHRTKWNFGSNVLSDWRQETEAEWNKNAEHLATYEEVAPLALGEIIPEPREKQAGEMRMQLALSPTTQ